MNKTVKVDVVNEVVNNMYEKYTDKETGEFVDEIHIKDILIGISQIISYYINKMEISDEEITAQELFVLGMEKGIITNIRDDINRLAKRYK